MSDRRTAVPTPFMCASSAANVSRLAAASASFTSQAAGRSLSRPLLFLVALFLLAAQVAGPKNAWAQAAADTGTLIVRIKSNQIGSAPVLGAAVNLSSETERPRSKVSTTGGLATFTALPSGTYSILVTSVGFRMPPRRDNVVVAAGQTVTVDFSLEPVGPTEVNVNASVELLERTNTSDYTRRNRAFWTEFPVGVGNQQSLNRILRSVPGFVPNSLDQVHARGESPVTNATYLDGFLVPQFAALSMNRAFFLPDSIDSLDIQTGGFAPEIGQASGSVTKITTRRTPYYTTGELTLKAGEYGTTEDYITVGGSTAGNRDRHLARAAQRASGGGKRRATAGSGQVPTGALASAAPRNLSYLLSLSQRFTDYGSETPQSGGFTANNNLASEVIFGKIDYKLNNLVDVTGLINYASGRTQSPNRTGLDASYVGFGQGFGFGGLQSRQAGLFGGSQNDFDLSIRQKDNNNLNLLQVKRAFKSGARLVTSFASTRSAQDIETEGSNFVQNLKNLPADSPTEFLPTLNSKYSQASIQVDYSAAPSIGKKKGDIHNFKAGVVYHAITDNEGYQLIPQSQTALNALAQMEPALAPNGSFVNGVFVVDPNNPQSPILTVAREGAYGAVYLQDTWRIRAPLTLNYGVRADFYQMNIKELKTGVTSYGGNKDDVNKTEISPRANLALVLPKSRKLKFLGSQPTIFRVSYNRLFVTPSLGQGDIIPNQGARTQVPGIIGNQNAPIVGNSVVPQITSLYDASLERQFGSKAVGKATVYHKDITHLVGGQQLIPLVQAGLVSATNFGDATVDGAELTLEIVPPRTGKGGFHGYLTFANSTSSPVDEFQSTNLKRSNSTPFFEWDQNNTLNVGLAYTAKTGATLGVNLYYGDGLYASALTNNGSIVRNNNRQSINEVDLRLASGPRLAGGRVGIELQVENLFGSRKRLNYQSYLTGTRFQQERRLLGAVTARF